MEMQSGSSIVSRSRERFDAAWARSDAPAALHYLVKYKQSINSIEKDAVVQKAHSTEAALSRRLLNVTALNWR